jgi:methylmalonyl-CoA mutase cobalamin-binding domain/chain
MSLDALCKAVEAGEQEESRKHAQALLDGGTDPLRIIEALTKVMDGIGEKFSRLEIFLPEMMLSGEAMADVVKLISPLLKEKGTGPSKGMIVLGTVKGDLHEIGKNIVKLMLESNLFEVRDIGIDADPVDFIRTAEETDAQVIGASALMSTTLPHQKEIIDILKEKGLRDKYRIVIGGAPATKEWGDEIGADLYCPDAGSAASMINTLLG